MAGFLNTLGKIFGNKYDKDIAKISPIVKEINQQYENLKDITHNELRNKTTELKKRINDFILEEKTLIKNLKEKSQSKDLSQ